MVPPNKPELLRRGHTSNSGASPSPRFGGDRAACPFEITPDLAAVKTTRSPKTSPSGDSIPGWITRGTLVDREFCCTPKDNGCDEIRAREDDESHPHHRQLEQPLTWALAVIGEIICLSLAAVDTPRLCGGSARYPELSG